MKVNFAVILFTFAFIGFSDALSRRKRYPTRQANFFNCDLEPDVGQEHGGRPVPPRRGSNGFSVAIESQPESFEPEHTYTISIKSTHPVTMRGFALDAMFEGTNEPAGSFTIINPWISNYMDTCPEVVTHRSLGKKNDVQFSWNAPSSTDKCVVFKASVIQKGSIWFKGSLQSQELTARFCPREETRDEEVAASVECCSCGSATYRMTFHGIWSPESHPKDYPKYSTHWSNVIGASHSQRYTVWEEGGYASEGVKRVAEWGWPNTLEDEIKGQGDAVKSIIKTAAQWPAYKPRNIGNPLADDFEVDREHNLVSLVSMLGPSPDWNVGITKESMCTQSCGWLAEKTFDLIPWDAGTDNGVSYISPNSPTNPPEKIRFLTSSDHPQSPFYDEAGGSISPVARVVLHRLSLSGDQCGVSEDVVGLGEEYGTSQQCVYSDWSEWSQCGVSCGWGIKTSRKSLRSHGDADCKDEVTKKEICKGASSCDGDESVTECLYTDWSAWSDCPQPCQPNDLRIRTRVIKWPSEPAHCRDLKEMSPCVSCDQATDTCMYTDWSEWMPCSSQCGVGETLRKRVIKRQSRDGSPCSSELMQRNKCMTSADCQQPDPSFDISGCSYSPWTGWMPCPAKCGVGETFRKRVLTTTSDSHCDEVQMERTKCMTSQACEAEDEKVVAAQSCMYTEWTDWMPCSKSCGVGLTFRKSLLKLAPEGLACDEVRMENSTCHMPPCPQTPLTQDCMYGAWEAWMPCSVSCGKGTTLRKRFLKQRLTADAECDDFEMETNRCMVPMICPQPRQESQPTDDCQWGEWTECSATCGSGKQMRKRPSNCGENVEMKSCDAEVKCPVDCLVSEWSDWSNCSPCASKSERKRLHVRSSSKGWRIRSRERLKKRRHGGAQCPARKEKRRCLC